MKKEVKSQTKVCVGVGALRKALAKVVRFVIPIIIPNLVKQVQVIEGDGGPGTVLLFNFGFGESSFFLSFNFHRAVILNNI